MKLKNKNRVILISILVLMSLLLAFLSYNFEYRQVREYELENAHANIGDFVSSFGNIAVLKGDVFYYDKELLTLEEVKSGDYKYQIRSLDEKITYDYGEEYVKSYGSYYFSLDLEDNSSGYGFILPEIGTAYKIFVDGNEIFEMGKVGKSPLEHRAKFKLDTVNFKSNDNKIEVVLQVSNFDYRVYGMLSNILLANSQTVKGYNNLVYSKTAALSSASFILAVFYISIFILLRKNMEYLYFSMFALMLTIRTLTYDSRILFEFFNFSWKTELDISLITTSFSIVFLIQYFRSLYRQIDKELISKTLIYIYILMLLPISMATGSALRGHLINFMIVIHFATVLYIIYLLFIGIRKSFEGSFLTLISMLGIFIAYYIDVKNGYIQNYVTYSLYLLLIMQGVVLGVKFSNSYIRLGDAREDLSRYVSILREKNIELVDSKNSLSIINKNLDKIVLEKTKTVKALLDNGELKIMYIDQEVSVGNEYSDNCYDIFKKDIRDLNFLDLMYEDNNPDKDFNYNLISRIFREEDKKKKMVYMTLLPEEYTVNNHVLMASYKLLKLEDRELIMIILDDVTKERALEDKYLKDIREMRATLSAVLDISEFKKLVNDFIEFWDHSLFDTFEKRLDDQAFKDEIMRTVHCQKGNFSIYRRSELVERLHEIEDMILSYETMEIDELISKLKAYNMSQFIRDDINKMFDLYGYHIDISQNYIEIKESRIIEIIDLLKGLNIDNDVILKLEELRDICFGVIAKKYDEYISDKEKLGQIEFKPLKVEGSDIKVSKSKVSHINNILNVCIRNIVYHAIESPIKRNELGKSPKASIEVSLVEEDDKYLLTITDDGRGIDLDELKKRRYEMDMESYSSPRDVSYEDAISLIYNDGFTTSKVINTGLGRGFGMSSLYNEIRSLKGKLSIETKYNFGTSICVEILK